VATKLGFEGKELVDAQEQMTALYNLFIGCDATQVTCRVQPDLFSHMERPFKHYYIPILISATLQKSK
jgi:hypothetical protein